MIIAHLILSLITILPDKAVWCILFCLFQELRLEDYQAGRKGPANPMAAGTGSLFGTATATSSATTGLFGSTGANTGFPFGQNKSNFGAPG